MIPTSLSEYLPYTGIILLLVGVVFAVVAMADSPSKNSTDPVNSALSQAKFSQLSYALVLAGGFILLASSK